VSCRFKAFWVRIGIYGKAPISARNGKGRHIAQESMSKDHSFRERCSLNKRGRAQYWAERDSCCVGSSGKGGGVGLCWPGAVDTLKDGCRSKRRQKVLDRYKVAQERLGTPVFLIIYARWESLIY